MVDAAANLEDRLSICIQYQARRRSTLRNRQRLCKRNADKRRIQLRNRLAKAREWVKHKETDRNWHRKRNRSILESTHHMTNVGVSLLIKYSSQKVDNERVESVELFLVTTKADVSKVTSSIERNERVIARAGKRLDAYKFRSGANLY